MVATTMVAALFYLENFILVFNNFTVSFVQRGTRKRSKNYGLE